MGGSLGSTYIASSKQLGAGLALVESKDFGTGTVEFTGLVGVNYRLVLQIAAGGAGGGNIEINGDTTATNYYTQYLSFTGGGVSTGAVNANSALHTENGGGFWIIDFSVDNASHGCYHTKGNVSLATPIVQEYFGARTASTMTTFSSIKVISSGGVTITGNAKLYRIYST